MQFSPLRGTRIRDRARDSLLVAAVVATLTAINLAAHFTAAASWFVTVPLGVAALVGLARMAGLTWSDLGISRATAKKGALYGSVAVLGVAAVVGVGVALPITREFFLNEAYASLRTALVAALVIIPLQTVLPEELAFRGVLHGSLQRLGGVRLVFVGGAVFFGLWHVASSLNLTASNAGLSGILGSGSAAQWAGVGLAVGATALGSVAFTWLRHRTGSVLAPIGLHWAFNAVGALAAATAWQLI